MLIEHRPFYQFTFFVLHGVVGTPEWVTKLSPGFGELDMMPSLVSHPNMYLGLGEQPANLQQLNFVTTQKDWVVIFDNDRIVIQAQIIPNQKLPSFEEFILKAEKILNVFSKTMNTRATRLGFVTTGICEPMDINKLNQIHQKLFNFPDEFKDNTTEWNSRQVYITTKKINDKNEKLNVILDTNRIQTTHHFEHKPIAFDGIEIGIDVNTYQGDSSQRFSVDDIAPFLQEAHAIENNLENSLQELFGG
jgi:uncharacterized protein (TIGR04255 family)